MRIRDPGSGMEKIWIQDGKNLDPESGINIPDQQNLKSRRQICWDLKNRVIIEPLVEKAFRDETKSFLPSKAASAALKRGKTPVNWIFTLQQDTATVAELRPQGLNHYCSLPS